LIAMTIHHTATSPEPILWIENQIWKLEKGQSSQDKHDR
jgi:hypothetical protein